MNRQESNGVFRGQGGVWAFMVVVTVSCAFVGLHLLVNAVNEHVPGDGWENLITLSKLGSVAVYLIAAAVCAVFVFVLKPRRMKYTLRDVGAFVALMGFAAAIVGSLFQSQRINAIVAEHWKQCGAQVSGRGDGPIDSILLGGSIPSLPNDPRDWRTLRNLIIYKAPFSSALLTSIPQVRTLHTLSMNGITRDWRLGVLLSKFPNLQVLSHESGTVSNEDAIDIASHPTLSNVSVAECHIGIVEILEIMHAKNLQRMSLRGTRVTDADLLEIASRYDGVRQISIYAYGTPVTREGMQAAKNKCPLLTFD